MATPGLALGHAELVSSNPIANASLLEAPPAVVMIFSEAIDPASASVDLLDDLQRPVVGVGAVQVDKAGRVLTVRLPQLDPAVYRVSYQVTSAVDGHVSTGTWGFLVDPTGTLPPPAIATQSSSPSGDPLTVGARWLALAGGLVLLGLPIFWILSARPSLRRAGEPAAAPWGAIAIVAALAFAGLAAYLTLAARPFIDASAGHVGHGGGGALPLDFAAPFGATSFATAMRLSEVGTGAAFLLATARYFALDEMRRRGMTPARDRDPAILGLVAAAAAFALAGSSLGGHADARGGVLFAGVDWLHLMAVGAWVGTLPGLLLIAARANRLQVGGRTLLGEALRRHSRVALAATPLVALTGIANSPLVLGGARGLVASAYGNVLLAKVVLFSVAVAIGSANFFLIRGGALRRTVPLIAVELAIGALAVLAASYLVTAQPAASQVPTYVPPPDTGIGVPLPLAWLWVALPAGPAGWLVPIGLLLALVGASAVERRSHAAGRGQRAVRLALVVLAVVAGLGVGSRAAAEAANRPPASAARAVNPVRASAESLARGHNLYLANCVACHGTGGAGDGPTSAGRVPGPGDLSRTVPERTDGELAYLIASGTVATRMPAFSTTLSENDRWDLVNYLRATWPGHAN